MLLPVSSIFDAALTEREIDVPRCSALLVQGDSGADVSELQRLLVRWSAFSGYCPVAAAQGQFDEAVRKAVETFQATMFLQPNGVVGTLTWRSLYSGAPVDMPTLHPGDQGVEVSRLQRILIATADLPADHLVNCLYDLTTEKAVQDIQSQAGLPVTGIVEAETWRALSRAIAYSRIASSDH